MEVMMSSPVQECSLMEIDNGNDALNLTKSKRKRRQKAHKRQSDENLGSVGETDPNTGIGTSTTVDKTPTEKSTRMTKDLNGEVEVQMKMETMIGETSSASNVIDNTTSKRRKRKKMENNNPDSGDILSTRESAQAGSSTTKVLEVKSGETVSAKAAAPDANMMSKGDHTEDASGKTGESETTNPNVNGKEKKKRKTKSENKRPTLGEILNPQYLQNLEAARVEMDSGTTSIGNSALQQRTREKMMNNNPDLGDMLCTRESTHEGLSTTKVFELKSGETVLANTATLGANIVSNGDHAEVSVGKAGESETANLNVNGKEKKKRKPKSKNKRPTLGEILNPLYLQNLEAATDNRASKKHKRQRLNGNSDVGDILSTHESTYEGLSTTKGDHLEVVNGKMQENETNSLNVKGKKKKKKKKTPKSKNNETGLESTDLKSIASPQVANSEMGSTTTVLKEITQVATSGKKLIILDVNGLLADVLTERPKDIVADKYIPRRAIFKRPYLDDFLCFCFERFEVGIWSSRAMKILVPVINFLLGDLKKKLLFLWDSCKCTDSGTGTLEVKHKNVVVKDLRKIWDEDGPKKSWVKGTFHESNTLLVDDSPYKALLNPKHTGIFPASYSDKNRDDNFLAPKGELQTYLEGLAAADDVKTYVEQHPFGQGAIDEHNPHWAFYLSIIERLNDKNIMGSLYKKSQDKKRKCRKDFYHSS